jgi:pimeloyl-ACP methyl ester carboxylesterase
MKSPVMMVHGMCCTAEVWDGFRAFFEQYGTRVYTPTLRSELRTSLRGRPNAGLASLRFGDYVDDLVLEAKRIEFETGRKPAVIGHSMGGLLAQALAERDCVSAAAWISPAPPNGCRDLQSGAFWLGVRAANALRIAPSAIKPQRRQVHAQVFNALPEAEREAAYAGMVYESGPAFAGMGRLAIDESKIRVPVLTVAASRDKLVPAKLVRCWRRVSRVCRARALAVHGARLGEAGRRYLCLSADSDVASRRERSTAAWSTGQPG